MKRVAIVGGGIAGVSAAYELARQQQAGADVDFTLFEATRRLGGIVETERHGDFIIECGPDSWVSEKPWARELAIELGLESEIIFSQDEHRKTYLAEGNALRALPDGMRMMVPIDWAGVLNSSLFSEQAKLEYQREPERAEQLKATALDRSLPARDESVRDFVVRHFGGEVADTIAAPLLAGVLGGNIATLSVRAVMPAYVALEREHGSLILGLRSQQQKSALQQPVFTTLRNGLCGLIEAMESRIAASSICREFSVKSLEEIDDRWRIQGGQNDLPVSRQFDAVLLATPAKATAGLLATLDPQMTELLPQRSSSAIVVAFAFSPDQVKSIEIPRGFGFLVPQPDEREVHLHAHDVEALAQQALLACTFVDQKFPHRVPAGGMLLRAFWGGPAASTLLQKDDATLRVLAHKALEKILGKLPKPIVAPVRRWPDSLPLYAVGHLDRIREVEFRAAQLPHVRLIGNAYRGVGLPDLIRDARKAAREIVAGL